MKRYLTVPEAAKETGKTERAIWMQIYRGQFPHRRWGKRVLIPRDEFELFLKNLPGVSAEEAIEKAEVRNA